jgi:hypothetical protein
MRISAKSSISVCVALMAFFTPVLADESDKENLGCIWLDASAPELNIDPADQMQRWCDLTPDRSEIACFDFSVGGEWGKTASFPAEYILGQQKAGDGLCPSISDRSSPIIRD